MEIVNIATGVVLFAAIFVLGAGIVAMMGGVTSTVASGAAANTTLINSTYNGIAPLFSITTNLSQLWVLGMVAGGVLLALIGIFLAVRGGGGRR